MRILLDTHIVLWWLDDRPRLRAPERELVASGEHEVYVSALTAAEIALKSSIGKLKAPADLDVQLAAYHFIELPLTARHGLALADLPWHHRDPFDRLLIAQARCEDLTILTADRHFEAYDVRVIPA